MKNLIILATLLAAGAHAGPVACMEGKDCELKWLKAMNALEMISRTRIQFMSDTRVQTFPPTPSAIVGGSIVKTPTATGYEISLRLECYYRSSCESINTSAQKSFELHVSDFPETKSP